MGFTPIFKGQYKMKKGYVRLSNGAYLYRLLRDGKIKPKILSPRVQVMIVPLTEIVIHNLSK